MISQQFSDAEQEEFVEIFKQEEQHLGDGFLEGCLAILNEMTQLLETQYNHQYKYLLDSVSSKRVPRAAA